MKQSNDDLCDSSNRIIQKIKDLDYVIFPIIWVIIMGIFISIL